MLQQVYSTPEYKSSAFGRDVENVAIRQPVESDTKTDASPAPQDTHDALTDSTSPAGLRQLEKMAEESINGDTKMKRGEGVPSLSSRLHGALGLQDQLKKMVAQQAQHRKTAGQQQSTVDLTAKVVSNNYTECVHQKKCSNPPKRYCMFFCLPTDTKL